MAGIISYGAYIPFHRMPRDVISKAWAGGRERGRMLGEKAVPVKATPIAIRVDLSWVEGIIAGG